MRSPVRKEVLNLRKFVPARKKSRLVLSSMKVGEIRTTKLEKQKVYQAVRYREKRYKEKYSWDILSYPGKIIGIRRDA